MTRRAGLYARVSTDAKGQDPAVQLQSVRGLAALLGWTVADRGRREWRRLLEDARQGRIDLVLVWKLDRFAWSADDALPWLQQLAGAGGRA